jgi:signal transduction histidine kinase/ligand-binding sensor domain-containing protein
MRRLALVIFLSNQACLLIAQNIPDHILFDHLPVPGTIHSVLTEDITTDEYGMMWIAKDALYRYDGHDFKKYNFIANDSTVFNSRETTVLYWDQQAHRLLVGTRNFGVVQYNYVTDQLDRLATKGGVPAITDIAATAEGILVTSKASGIFRLENDTLVRATLPGDIVSPAQIIAGKKSTWIAAQNEIIVIRHGGPVERIRFEDMDTFANTPVRANCMTFDHLGRLWVGTERDGVAVVDTSMRKVIRKFLPTQEPFFSPIVQIVRDAGNLMWIGTKGSGLIICDPVDYQVRHIRSNDRAPRSLTGDHCSSIFLDATGIVWIGSSGDINKYDRQQIKFKLYNHNPFDDNSLSDDGVRNIYFDDEETIYVLTAGGFINVINRKTGKIERIRPVTIDSNAPSAPMCIVRYDKENMLVSTSNGLLRYHTKSKSLRFFEPLKHITPGSYMRQIIRHQDTFYMLLGGSVLRYTPLSGEIVTYGEESNIQSASALAVDDENRLWAGTRHGVAYSDPGQKKFNVITLGKDMARPDSALFMALSLQQIGNELWINSFNYGTYVIDLRQEPPAVVSHFTAQSGLGDNTIYASIPDARGNVWITHNSGLTCYDPQTRMFARFFVSEGLQNEEFNRLAFSLSPAGLIAVGGTSGLNVFDPEKIVISSRPQQIRLIDLTAFSLNSFDEQPLRASLLGEPNEVQVPHNFNSLRFSFQVPDYQTPARYEIHYKLEPFDKHWVKTSQLTTTVYANLLPGVYDFSVRAISHTGEETVAHVTVSVIPPYWKRWWFLVLSAIICSFLVYSVIYSRVQANKRETRRLESLLKFRTREIEQSREDLANLNRKKDLIFSILSHDLRSPLTTLKGFLGLLIDNSDALTKEELQKYATNICNSVTTSLDLIDNTLFWSLSQTGTIHCIPAQLSVSVLFDKIRDLYQLTAEKKRISIAFAEVNGMSVMADENMVHVVLRNLVSNAIKFTPELNSVIVDATRVDGMVSIRIKDHGVGMSQHEIDNIFTLDNPIVKKGTSSEKGTGLGLLLCKKFVELNKGKLQIESRLGEGSTFTVLLPAG